MKDEGGSAFPWESGNGHEITGSTGMTLRDWFAGQALAGRMSRNSVYKSWQDAAIDAYETADAMIKERNKGKGE